MKKLLIVVLSFGLGCSQGSYKEYEESTETYAIDFEEEECIEEAPPLTHDDSVKAKTDSIIRTVEYRMLMYEKKKQQAQRKRDSIEYELYLAKQYNRYLNERLYQETLVRNVPVDTILYVEPTVIQIELDSSIIELDTLN